MGYKAAFRANVSLMSFSDLAASNGWISPTVEIYVPFHFYVCGCKVMYCHFNQGSYLCRSRFASCWRWPSFEVTIENASRHPNSMLNKIIYSNRTISHCCKIGVLRVRLQREIYVGIQNYIKANLQFWPSSWITNITLLITSSCFWLFP